VRKRNNLLFPKPGGSSMSAVPIITTVVKSLPRLTWMVLSLLWMYLTLGRRVHKTRKAFEKQLIQQGMSKKDAQRLSACFEDLKDNVTGMLKQGISGISFQTK
jgi:hypothetical protein